MAEDKNGARRVSAKAAKPTAPNEGVPQQPQVAPMAMPGADYSAHIFTQLSAIQNQLGGLQSSVKHLDESLQSAKSKVDDLADLKNKVIGGFWVLGVVFTVLSGLVGWSMTKVWDTVSAIAAPAIRESANRSTPQGAPAEPPPVMQRPARKP